MSALFKIASFDPVRHSPQHLHNFLIILLTQNKQTKTRFVIWDFWSGRDKRCTHWDTRLPTESQ